MLFTLVETFSNTQNFKILCADKKLGKAANYTQNVWAHDDANKEWEDHGNEEASSFPSMVFVKHQLNEILWAFSKRKSNQDETDISCEK